MYWWTNLNYPTTILFGEEDDVPVTEKRPESEWSRHGSLPEALEDFVDAIGAPKEAGRALSEALSLLSTQGRVALQFKEKKEE